MNHHVRISTGRAQWPNEASPLQWNRRMKMSRIQHALLVATCTVIAACSSGPKVRVDGDPSVDMRAYKTFAFFDHLATDKANYSTMITSRLKEATARELSRRGLSEDNSAPQLLVNFSTNVETRTEVHSSPSTGFYGYRAGVYGAWGTYPQDVYTTHYQQGTLVIDLVDAQRKQLVWQGLAEAHLSKKDIENPSATIDSVIAEIFAKYPVPAPQTAAQ